jgi:hypothetical protein
MRPQDSCIISRICRKSRLSKSLKDVIPKSTLAWLPAKTGHFSVLAASTDTGGLSGFE